MTAKTLSLNTRQWRVLLHDNLDVLKAAVAGTETIDETGLKQIHAQLDDMKMLAVAWFQVGVPTQIQTPSVAETADVPAQADGAAPKPKGGWPKGKPRKQRNAPGIAQAVQ